MSVFGGDSWGREAQQRKRRIDDLMLSASSSSSLSTSSSFKKLSNGKFVCLVCPHNPVLDSPLMLSMHNKGSRHIAQESKLTEKEFKRKEELNKRIALSLESINPPNKTNPSSNLTKPLVEQTRRAILELQSSKFKDQNAKSSLHGEKTVSNASLTDTKLNNFSDCEGDQSQKDVHSDWYIEVNRRREKELKFTAAGWKRDCHGKWYRDENVEFDSDDEDPNVSLD